MRTTTPAQLKAIHALLNDNGLRDEKDSIVSGFTGGRTSHSSKMTKAEAAALIGHLKSLDQTEGRSEKMRNKILALAHEMQWQINGRVDMERVNNWCKKYGHAHVPLDSYTYAELPQLVSQFEAVYKSHLKQV